MRGCEVCHSNRSVVSFQRLAAFRDSPLVWGASRADNRDASDRHHKQLHHPGHLGPPHTLVDHGHRCHSTRAAFWSSPGPCLDVVEMCLHLHGVWPGALALRREHCLTVLRTPSFCRTLRHIPRRLPSWACRDDSAIFMDVFCSRGTPSFPMLSGVSWRGYKNQSLLAVQHIQRASSDRCAAGTWLLLGSPGIMVLAKSTVYQLVHGRCASSDSSGRGGDWRHPSQGGDPSRVGVKVLCLSRRVSGVQPGLSLCPKRKYRHMKWTGPGGGSPGCHRSSNGVMAAPRRGG
ncbi:hypothetical protein F5X68DRAFT_38971 [Plectosphaerella plurivora]|uniref:Uncharacterized protein n=1 Tax=Plectosphaerella plurivora TaxID=936078 RepID=A0A9P8V557_9PEZI|nr:hypothetical protein F5X68DRAFT_38971 [Plectosphaerella plurivora]